MDEERIKKALEEALLSDEEMKNVSSWREMPNPFFGGDEENGGQLFELDAGFFLDDEEEECK